MINDSYYCYELVSAYGVVVHRGITKNPSRRQQEHRQRWFNSNLHIVFDPITKDQALFWESHQTLTITPEHH